mmetsp:Transcript_61422/g.163434  ORF Transcript_61422/g.163434 Transcript_61422/m.163434 type:complete len:204 (+) Transcript_61422:1290-1901(+)
MGLEHEILSQGSHWGQAPHSATSGNRNSLERALEHAATSRKSPNWVCSPHRSTSLEVCVSRTAPVVRMAIAKRMAMELPTEPGTCSGRPVSQSGPCFWSQSSDSTAHIRRLRLVTSTVLASAPTASWAAGNSGCPSLRIRRRQLVTSEHVARFLAVSKYVAMRRRDQHVGECAPRTRQKSCNWRHRPRPRRAVVTEALAVGSL